MVTVKTGEVSWAQAQDTLNMFADLEDEEIGLIVGLYDRFWILGPDEHPHTEKTWAVNCYVHIRWVDLVNGYRLCAKRRDVIPQKQWLFG